MTGLPKTLLRCPTRSQSLTQRLTPLPVHRSACRLIVRVLSASTEPAADRSDDIAGQQTVQRPLKPALPRAGTRSQVYSCQSLLARFRVSASRDSRTPHEMTAEAAIPLPNGRVFIYREL